MLIYKEKSLLDCPRGIVPAPPTRRRKVSVLNIPAYPTWSRKNIH